MNLPYELGNFNNKQHGTHFLLCLFTISIGELWIPEAPGYSCTTVGKCGYPATTPGMRGMLAWAACSKGQSPGGPGPHEVVHASQA